MQALNTTFRTESLIVDCTHKGNTRLKDLLEVSDHHSNMELKADNTTSNSRKSVLVLGGGMSSEREVSLMSSNSIIDSLLELGTYYVIFIDMGADIAQVINKLKPNVVFNALHGTYGEDGCIPGLLNIMRVPYTGPGVLTSALALNKKRSREILQSHSIKIPYGVTVNINDNILQNDPIPRPYVIKPISQGSSIGVKIIFNQDQFSFSDYQFQYGDEVLVEKYISGREMQVAVLNGNAMEVLEIQLQGGQRFYDYQTKYDDVNHVKYLVPAPIKSHIRDKMLKLSESVCQIFDCTKSGMIRVEFIYNEYEDEVYLLELNTHPGMSPASICPKIASSIGLNYSELINKILQSARFET